MMQRRLPRRALRARPPPSRRFPFGPVSHGNPPRHRGPWRAAIGDRHRASSVLPAAVTFPAAPAVAARLVVPGMLRAPRAPTAAALPRSSRRLPAPRRPRRRPRLMKMAGPQLRPPPRAVAEEATARLPLEMSSTTTTPLSSHREILGSVGAPPSSFGPATSMIPFHSFSSLEALHLASDGLDSLASALPASRQPLRFFTTKTGELTDLLSCSPSAFLQIEGHRSCSTRRSSNISSQLKWQWPTRRSDLHQHDISSYTKKYAFSAISGP